MALDAIFGSKKDFRVDAVEFRDDHGKKLYKFEYRYNVPVGKKHIKQFVITGTFDSGHPAEKVNKIYDNLRKTIDTRGSKVKPIHLQTAIEDALHRAKDLKSKDIQIVKAKVKK